MNEMTLTWETWVSRGDSIPEPQLPRKVVLLTQPHVAIRGCEAEIAGRWVPLLPLEGKRLGFVVTVAGRVYDLLRSFSLRWPGVDFQLPDTGVRLHTVAQIAAR